MSTPEVVVARGTAMHVAREGSGRFTSGASGRIVEGVAPSPWTPAELRFKRRLVRGLVHRTKSSRRAATARAHAAIRAQRLLTALDAPGVDVVATWPLAQQAERTLEKALVDSGLSKATPREVEAARVQLERLRDARVARREAKTDDGDEGAGGDGGDGA